MAWYNVSQWMSCVFCQSARATHHRLCNDCWDNLPWDLAPQHRHDVKFTSACFYKHPMEGVLHQFKDNAQLHYLPLLKACLLQIPKPQVQAIVPMPISTEKLIIRGYSQTFLLANALSKAWDLPIWQPVKRHYGQSQRHLDRLQRLENVEQQFYVASDASPQYKKILMLDDVITTGSSLFALQEKLKDLNCHHIQAICVCNALI